MKIELRRLVDIFPSRVEERLRRAHKYLEFEIAETLPVVRRLAESIR
jgi:hypothetical protein